MSSNRFCTIADEAGGGWKKFYTEVGKLGEGAYGTVIKARCMDDPTVTVAIKQIKRREPDSKTGIPQDAYREIKILKELSHENIVKLQKVILSPDSTEVHLVYEEAEYDLQEMIRWHKRHGDPDIRVVKSTIRQILEGLNFLHKNWVMHRDMKPANVLVKRETRMVGVGSRSRAEDFYRVKIADFGLARVFQSPLRPLCVDGEVVTIWYRAPELLLGSRHYTRAIDIWAVGCIFAEFLIKKAIFMGDEAKKGERATHAVPGRPDAEDHSRAGEAHQGAMAAAGGLPIRQ